MRQELLDLPFGAGIVANAPIGMIDRPLQVDQQQRRTLS